jgi:RimJ/RimL family protein N-acetyltransferase
MICGNRVRLRGVERSDLPKFQEWLNDPEVNEGLGMYLPLSTSDEEQWFNSVSRMQPDEKPLSIEIKQGRGWRLVGNVGFFNLEWTNRSSEFGIFIGDKTIWNRGYGTEAVQLLLQHGFETLNLHRIFLRVFSTNPRARRSYEKAGFILEGTLREAVYRHGRYADVHIMSVLRSEWNAVPEGK